MTVVDDVGPSYERAEVRSSSRFQSQLFCKPSRSQRVESTTQIPAAQLHFTCTLASTHSRAFSLAWDLAFSSATSGPPFS